MGCILNGIRGGLLVATECFDCCFQYRTSRPSPYLNGIALAGGATIALILAALIYVVIILADNGVSIATTYLIAHCLSLDMGFHKEHTPGELLERIDGDVDALSNFFSQFVIYLLTNVVLLIGVLIALFFADWRAGLAMTCCAIITLLILMRIRRIATPRWVAYRQMQATFFGFLGEYLAGTEDIRANGAATYVLQRFYVFLRPLRISNRKAEMASNY